MNILVCGTRESLPTKRMEVVNDVLSGFLPGFHLLIEGAASGVDSYAYGWAFGHGWGTRRFPADWTRFGKRAGPIRNQQMLDESWAMGYPVDIVLAFPIDTSRGTWDMVERAVKNRIPVRVYPL